MWGLSIGHWVMVIGVIGLLFGVKQIPNMMGDLGKSLKEARKLPKAFEEG